MPARQSGSPRQQCCEVISAFVDSIDSHIILRMIRESKMKNFKKSKAKTSKAKTSKTKTPKYFLRKALFSSVS